MTMQTLLERTVQRLQQQGIPPVVDIISAANKVTEILFRYLWLQQSDLIESSTMLDFVVSDAVKDLPEDFYGFAGMPCIVADELTLRPADRYQCQTLADETGYPEYFAEIKKKIYLYPVPDCDVSLLVDYYVKPVDMTVLTASLPYNGLFDSLYEDGVMRIQKEGVVLEIDKEFKTLMCQIVGGVLTMRDPSSQLNGVEGCY